MWKNSLGRYDGEDDEIVTNKDLGEELKLKKKYSSAGVSVRRLSCPRKISIHECAEDGENDHRK